MLLRLALVAFVGVALAGRAGAETKSWAAVKGRVPVATSIVIGVDLKALRALPSFPKVLDSLAAESADFTRLLATVKTACGIEIF